MPNVKSKYVNIAELLQNALVARVAKLLSLRTCVPNLKSRYFNVVELLQNALVVRVGEPLSQQNICAKCELKIV